MQTEHDTSDPAETLRSAIAMLFRRKWLIVSVFAAVTVAGAAATLLMPKKYESSMKILVRSDRADLIVTPGQSSSLRVQEVDENRLNSEIELLTSRDLLQELVLRCQLYKTADSAEPGTPNPAAVDQAVRNLQEELKVIPVKKTAVMHITYAAGTPSGAATVLREMAKLYLEKHLAMRRSPGTQELFETQASTFENRLEEAESALVEFQQRTNVVSLELEQDLVLRRIQETEAEIHQTEAKLQESKRRISETQAQLTELKPREVTQKRSVGNASSVERLNTMLAELKNQRTELLTKFRSDDRLVKAVEQQIRDTEEAMTKAAGIVSFEEATDVNPLYRKLQDELAQAELDAATLEARRETLQTNQLAGYQARLEALTRATQEDEDLKRTIAEAEANYKLYTAKREEARIANLLDEQKIANVALAEEPTEPTLPSSPNVPLNLALSLVLASFLSLGSAAAAEFLSGAVRTPRDVEASTGLPVLATIAVNEESWDAR